MKRSCVIRVDSSRYIGVGHVARCLTLADALRRQGTEVHFVSREHLGSASRLIEEAGFPLHRLPPGTEREAPASHRQWLGVPWAEDARLTAAFIDQNIGVADWLVVDHYAIDAMWESSLRPYTRRIMAIDDLADHPHDCDLLLDQNLRDENPYGVLLPVHAVTLLGPTYALLRDEFREAHQSRRARSGEVNRLVVFFGGSDPSNETAKAVQALLSLGKPIEADVIVGLINPVKDQIEALCRESPHLHFHCQVSDMARFLLQSDLALGAAGVSSWERLATGLPALVVAVAENQMENMRQLDRHGLAIALGVSADVSVAGMAQAVENMLTSPERIKAMSEKALGMVDGKGVFRVVERMSAVMP